MYSVWSKLVTKDDSLHVHKIMGVMSLVNFAYRVCSNIFGIVTMDVPSLLNCTSLAVHLSLVLTSMQFRLPPRLFIGSKYFEYHEMRLHVLVFTSRAIALIILTWLGMRDMAGIRLLNVLVWHSLADLITLKWGCPSNGTTIRDATDCSRIEKLFASSSQLIAIGGLLGIFDHPTQTDLVFLTLLPIQMNTFLMTLGRKGFISERQKSKLYGALLLCLYPGLFRVLSMRSVLIICTMCIWRLGLGLSKYPMYVLVTLIR